MLRFAITRLVFLFSLISTMSAFSADQRTLSITRVDSTLTSHVKELRVRKEPITDKVQTVNPTGDMVWRVDGWVTGNELYKNFLDPSAACENPYPFTVTEINMPMYFAKPTVIVVSVDMEDVAYSSEDCAWPDSILAISSDYQLNVAEPGLYNLWIPLDEPVVVNRPFFVGFFIGNTVDTSAGVAVLTNGNTSATCRSYNIWDEHVGFVDMVNNGVWNFPGQLMLYAMGYPGDSEQRAEPEPQITILSPCDGRPLFGETTIWAYESSGSSIIEHVDFEYSTSGEYHRIGRDYDGTCRLRDSDTSSSDGNGYSHLWDFAALPEGNYKLKVTAVDTLGRSASDEISVYVEPTPPTPKIISPKTTSDFCSTFDVLMRCSDENLKRVAIYHKEARADYSAGIQALKQPESSNYNTAPVAAASAIKLWVDRGYTSLLDARYGDNATDSLLENLTDRFGIRRSGGTTDEAFYGGLMEFSRDHGGALALCNFERPDYSTIRVQMEEEENAVLLALGGAPGVWLAVDGFRGWSTDSDTYLITVANPLSGKIEALPLRDKPGGAELRFADDWRPVERIVTLAAAGWQVERRMLGDDTDESDGWSYSVASDELSPNTRHFIRAEGTDANGNQHYHTVILNYDCSNSYPAGDYDGDGVASIVDLAYLTDFVEKNGPEPVGGSFRADANGDSQLNVTDVVYYLNYLYGMADPPRH